MLVEVVAYTQGNTVYNWARPITLTLDGAYSFKSFSYGSHLQKLTITRCHSLESVSHFLKLHTLEVKNCWNFKTIEDMPALKILILNQCKSVINVPAPPQT